MAKYLVETYYTCSFKVNHYLDDINETELANLEKRDDGKFEVLDVKLDTRKTKSLDPNNKVIEPKKLDIISEQSQPKIVSKENNTTFVKKINEGVGKRFSMPDRRKGYIQKATLVTIKFIYILVNMKMEKLVKFLLIQVKKVS